MWNFCGRKGKASVYGLSHDIPAFDARAAARLLESNLRLALPNTIFLCVVDPGVGSGRKAVAVEAGNRSFLVGPHNGVFDLILRSLNSLYGIVRAVEISAKSRHTVSPAEGAVKTVDGDAIFSPSAGAIVKNRGIPNDLGREIPLWEFREVLPWDSARADGNGVVYGRIEEIDHYGTFVTNIPADLLGESVKSGGLLLVRGKESGTRLSVPYADHFAAVPAGQPLLTTQGNAFLHIAIREGSARDSLPFRVGEEVSLSQSPAQSS